MMRAHRGTAHTAEKVHHGLQLHFMIVLHKGAGLVCRTTRADCNDTEPLMCELSESEHIRTAQ